VLPEVVPVELVAVVLDVPSVVPPEPLVVVVEVVVDDPLEHATTRQQHRPRLMRFMVIPPPSNGE
jgi:hypothetical protein